MKTFDDLDFEPHSAGLGGTQARMDFENGYGVSVITGEIFYTDPEHPYELAVMKDRELCYDTPITNDVLGHLTSQEVTEYMEKIQSLDKQ